MKFILVNNLSVHGRCFYFVFIGLESHVGGRIGDKPSALSQSFKRMGLTVKRLRTGTPPRLDGRTIDYTHLLAQPSDSPPVPFSYLNSSVDLIVNFTCLYFLIQS